LLFLKPVPDLQSNSSNSRRRASRHIPVLVLAILALGGLGLWYGTSRGKQESVDANGPPAVRSTLHLETFVLNLADTDRKSYLRVGIDLGLSEEIKRGEEPPIAPVRDTILTVLGESKVNDLMTADGKAKLKQDLLRALRDRLPQLGVQEIYFTEFLIQR
jgi:flagellar basal body-associated protein FliL